MNSNNKNKISANEREELAFQLFKSAKEKIPMFFKPEQFELLLQLFSRFHRYSYINIILIYLQFSKAKYLAGFDTWQMACFNIWNDKDRQVLKQEYKGKGIRLLAPYTIAGKQERRLINFVVSVYDVSQTNGLPPLEQDDDYVINPKLKKLLSAFRYISPYRITVAGREDYIIQNGLSGYCDHNNKLIVLDEELKGVGLLAEMIREVTMAEIELSEYDDKEFNDLIVESVLYVLNQHFGSCVESEVNNLLFIERYHIKPLDDLATALFLIQRISHKVIESIEDFLYEIEEYSSFDWLDEEALMDFEFETVYLNEV